MNQDETEWVDRSEEIDTMQDNLVGHIAAKKNRNSSTYRDDPEYHEYVHEQIRAVALAAGRADYDALRVFTAFDKAGTEISFDALTLVIRSVRTAIDQDVYPAMRKLHLELATEVSLTISKMYDTYYETYKGGVFPNGNVCDAVRAACALGTAELSAYIAANVNDVVKIAADRDITDGRSLISILESMMSDAVSPLRDGTL